MLPRPGSTLMDSTFGVRILKPWPADVEGSKSSNCTAILVARLHTETDLEEVFNDIEQFLGPQERRPLENVKVIWDYGFRENSYVAETDLDEKNASIVMDLVGKRNGKDVLELEMGEPSDDEKRTSPPQLRRKSSCEIRETPPKKRMGNKEEEHASPTPSSKASHTTSMVMTKTPRRESMEEVEHGQVESPEQDERVSYTPKETKKASCELGDEQM